MTLVYRFVEHGPLMPYSWHIPNRKSTPRCLDGAFNAWFARSAHVRMSAPLQHLVSAYFVWVFFNALKFSLQLVDPNTKLQREFKRIKEDPYEVSTDEVLEWSAHPHVGRSGKPSVKCTIKTPWRTFSVWYMPTIGHEWAMLNKAVYKGHIAPSVDVFLQYLDSHGTPPETVTYHRIRGSRFYKVLAYNRRADEVPQLD